MFPFSQRERLVVSYIWLIASRLFGLYVLSYVLGHLADRTEVLIVASIGMLFGVLSGTMRNLQYSMYIVSKQIADRKISIQKLIDPNFMTSDEYKKIAEFENSHQYHGQIKYAISRTVSLIIFMMCFLRFASVLPFRIF